MRMLIAMSIFTPYTLSAMTMMATSVITNNARVIRTNFANAFIILLSKT